MCMTVWVCTHVNRFQQRPGEGVGSSGAGVTGGWLVKANGLGVFQHSNRYLRLPLICTGHPPVTSAELGYHLRICAEHLDFLR